MKTVRIVLATLALASFLGCWKTTVTAGSGGNVSGTPTKTGMNMFFINGLIGSAGANVNEVCPGGNATVVVEHSLIDMLITGVCSGLVSPNTVSVYCGEAAAPAPAPAAQLTPEQVEELMASTNFEEKLEAAVIAAQ